MSHDAGLAIAYVIAETDASAAATPEHRACAGTMREATIDVGAIEANVRHLCRLTDSDLIAVVKADGYGRRLQLVVTRYAATPARASPYLRSPDVTPRIVPKRVVA